MSNPNVFEREYYDKLVGRQILAVEWSEIDGRPLPVLVLSGPTQDGQSATVSVLADPEGNGPGHLDHNL